MNRLGLLLLLIFSPTVFAGSIVAWGGDPDPHNKLDFPAGYDFVDIKSDNHVLALRSNGTLEAWGDCDDVNCDVPAGKFIIIDVDNGKSVAVSSDGSISYWGRSAGPSVPPSGNVFIAAAAGGGFCVALKNDGSLAAWGSDTHGGISNLPEGNNFIGIDVGSDWAVALKTDGSLVAWGDNDYGQLNVPSGNDFVEVKADGIYGLALRQDGSLAIWDPDEGQPILRDLPDHNDFIAIALGGSSGLAIRENGSLVIWGNTNNGKDLVPPGNHFVRVSVDSYVAFAIEQLIADHLTVIEPNGGEYLIAGETYPVRWASPRDINEVIIEYSPNNGSSWTPVYPSNYGNVGGYSWTVPSFQSDESLVRITNTSDSLDNDISDSTFTVYKCNVLGDLNKNCKVDFTDFAILAGYWLQCGNPFDANCP